MVDYVMFAIILIALSVALSLLSWLLVRSAPRVLSMVLPPRLTFAIGAGFFVMALLFAFIAAYVMRNPMSMLHCFVQGYVGLWFMLATSSGLRGSEADEQMLRRLFVMIGLVMGVIIASLYVESNQVMATLNFMLITAGYWMTRNFLSFLDRGR